MARAILFLALLLANGLALADVDWRTGAIECRERSQGNEAVMRACLSEHVAKQMEEERKEAERNQPKPIAFALHVRDSSTSVADFQGYDLGTKGGTISVERENGEDSTIAKVALIGRFPALLGGRAQPFVGASWIRNGTTAKRTDIRDFMIGSVGPLWESSGPGSELFSLLSTFQLTHREDLFGTSEGNLARAHFDLVWVPLANGSLGGFSVVPHVAGLWHRRTGGGTDDGTWSSAYAGVVVGKSFEVGQQRFQASLLGRKLYDTHVPTGNTKRRDHYANLSLDFFFYDPSNKKAPLQPSIFISREVGNDFLTGVDNANKTTAGFRIKFN